MKWRHRSSFWEAKNEKQPTMAAARALSAASQTKTAKALGLRFLSAIHKLTMITNQLAAVATPRSAAGAWSLSCIVVSLGLPRLMGCLDRDRGATRRTVLPPSRTFVLSSADTLAQRTAAGRTANANWLFFRIAAGSLANIPLGAKLAILLSALDG